MTQFGEWKEIGKDKIISFEQMPGCCRKIAAGVILKSSGEAPGIVCINCYRVWERVSEIDSSLAYKINILKGKA